MFALAFIGMIGLIGLATYTNFWSERITPRELRVGDSWTYKILFPDSKSYELTDRVHAISELNGTRVYVIFRDDADHISTQYMWISTNWFELMTFKPQIGNLLVNSTEMYSPPVEMFHIPFHVGDRWTIRSAVTTIVESNQMRVESTKMLHEERDTDSVEQITTPGGRFRAFKVTVAANGTRSETLWFDPVLGQVVYGEFYNGEEKVTQTLMSYIRLTSSADSLYAFIRAYTVWRTPCEDSCLGSHGKLYLSLTRHFSLQD